MRHGKHAVAAIYPGNTRAEMWQASNRDVRGGLAGVDVHHENLAAAARGAEQVPVGRVEEEVVERFLDIHAAECKQALLHGESFDHTLLMTMNETLCDGLCVGIGRNFPNLGRVF